MEIITMTIKGVLPYKFVRGGGNATVGPFDTRTPGFLTDRTQDPPTQDPPVPKIPGHKVPNLKFPLI